MHVSKTFFIALLLIGSRSASVQAGEVPLNLSQRLTMYLRDVQQLRTAVSLDYRSEVTLNGRQQVIQGRMALQGDQYYDSSNERFAFRNEDWLLVANHPSKRIKVVYIPKWKEQTGGKLELETSQFLFPDLNPKYIKSLQATQLPKDTTCIRFQYSPPDVPRSLEVALYYAGEARLPSRYEGTLTLVQTHPETGAKLPVSMRFQCWNVTTRVNPAVFNADRLIRVRGKDARLIRYTDYQAPGRMSRQTGSGN
ncbi:MAG: hypothetical protein EOP52_05670 [Sphingobacteriales bacterium]|nr:MAG: hypothetical protein EOP52_05670 [Sphingobacteriales bacterium]